VQEHIVGLDRRGHRGSFRPKACLELQNSRGTYRAWNTGKKAATVSNMPASGHKTSGTCVHETARQSIPGEGHGSHTTAPERL